MEIGFWALELELDYYKWLKRSRIGDSANGSSLNVTLLAIQYRVFNRGMIRNKWNVLARVQTHCIFKTCLLLVLKS